MNLQLIKWSDCPEAYTRFASDIEALSHPLPWHASEDNFGVIEDATGKAVAVINPIAERNDEEAYRIATSIVCAVNICAGFTVAPSDKETRQ